MKIWSLIAGGALLLLAVMLMLRPSAEREIDDRRGLEHPDFTVKIIQNDSPSPTLFLCDIEIKKDEVLICASGYYNGMRFFLRGVDEDTPRKYYDQLFHISDPIFLANMAIINRHFDLCVDGSGPSIVDGGIITEVKCSNKYTGRTLESRYLIIDPSWHRQRLMDRLGSSFDDFASASFTNDKNAKERAQAALFRRVNKLAGLITNYDETFKQLETSYGNRMKCNWGDMLKKVRLRPALGQIQNQTPLIQAGNTILNQAFSKPGFEKLIGRPPTDRDFCILRVGLIKRLYGGFSLNSDWDVFSDDEQSCYGFMVAPQNAAVPVGMLDVGLERLLIHFVLQDLSEGSNAYLRYFLGFDQGHWTIFDRDYSEESVMSERVKSRLDYLMRDSGLLAWLLGKEPDGDVHFVNIGAVKILNDHWDTAKIDYLLGNKQWILPFLYEENNWVPYNRWRGDEYYKYNNRIYIDPGYDDFRASKEVVSHGVSHVEKP